MYNILFHFNRNIHHGNVFFFPVGLWATEYDTWNIIENLAILYGYIKEGPKVVAILHVVVESDKPFNKIIQASVFGKRHWRDREVFECSILGIHVNHGSCDCIFGYGDIVRHTILPGFVTPYQQLYNHEIDDITCEYANEQKLKHAPRFDAHGIKGICGFSGEVGINT